MTDQIEKPVCMTIAGVDPSGGAGVIADIKTFTAFGCYAAAAISSLTFQNTTGVFGSVDQDAASIKGQISAVLDDLPVVAVKTGMLPNRGVIETAAALLKDSSVKYLVVDPVVRSTSGYDLIDDSALRAAIEDLFPLSSIVTPNLQEAERISGMKIDSVDAVRLAADKMISFGAKNVLIKGGHFFDDAAENRMAVDHLFTSGGDHRTFEAPFIETDFTHGTGCVLAAAITANLAKGNSLVDSIAISKEFVTEAIRTAYKLGRGHSPVNIPTDRRWL
ncbi:MAG: bifunctional hydroxymethylpyrimidine kinase/phosphomethylpyrimidine kinase [Chloracidobacterium sp.]|nr:bifunctional hydroxymethylpyrimidine kinase/phosphomethylpyrimidine kinase [Chloracidobacterium sp.]